MSHTLLIVNPTAGKGRAKAASDRLVDELRRTEPVDLFLTSASGDAERAAKEAVHSGCERVFAAGGDGTINEVVNGLAGSDAALGIIALGTANVLARELGLPIRDPEAAAAAIRSGSVRRIDLARANSRYFAAMAGIGFDAAVVRKVIPRVKGAIGVGAYVLAVADGLVRDKPAHFSLEIDGERVESEAFAVVVANSASYAYGVKVAPQASLEDGELDVIIFEKAPLVKLSLVYQALRVLRRTHLTDPNVRCYKGRRIRVEARPKVFMQLDGDSAGTSPADIEIVPKGLSVILPR